VDHHAVRDRRVARDRELRRLLDLHLAHPAASVNRKLRMVAVVRDLDAVVERDLEQRVPGLRDDLAAVDHHGDRLLEAALRGGAAHSWTRTVPGKIFAGAPAAKSSAFTLPWMFSTGRPGRSRLMRSWSLSSPSITASGRGGQPGT